MKLLPVTLFARGGRASLKLMLTQIALAVTLLICLIAPGYAAAPTLEPASEFPATVLPNHTYTFHLTYKQAEGDPPSTLQMVVDTPYGQASQRAALPNGNPVAGEDISWEFTPEQSGQYQYHFEVTSSTGGVARYPAGSGEKEFESPNQLIKYLVLAIGLVIGLFFMPFVVYLITRAANKYGDPSDAARVALLIGLLSFCGLAYYLFLYDNQDMPTKMLGYGIEAVSIGAFLIVIITRRRAV